MRYLPSLSGSAILVSAMLVPLIATADLVVLQYHHIATDTPAATSTSPDLFRSQLDRIAELNLEVAPLEEATEKALEGDAGQRQMIALTFDDAYSSIYDTAWPILLKRGLPFTLFVNTDAIDKNVPGYMSWEQIRELSESDLVTIGNHTSDHGHQVAQPDESRSQLKRRVEASLDKGRSSLRNNLDLEPRLFAYPYGEYSQTAQALVRARGWLGFGQHSGAIGTGSDPTALPRFPASNSYGGLDVLTDKLRSQSFPFDAATLPPSPIVENPPRLALPIPAHWQPQQLNCFASGQGKIDISTADEDTVLIQARRPFEGRRARYNCTYPAGDGRFHWLSQPWINPRKTES